MNKVILIGNITKDIELKQSQSGKFVTEFNIAINNGKDQQGNDLPADFINCTAWNKTAEILSKYTNKGSKIGIEGTIKTHTWVDQQGNNRYKTYVLVDRLELLGKSQNQQPAPQPTPQYEQQGLGGGQRDVTGFTYADIKPDDLPFY